MKNPGEILGAVPAAPDDRRMFLIIVNSRVYVFKKKEGRAAAAKYLKEYRGFNNIEFAEASVSRDIVPDSRKVRTYIKMHLRECLISEPVPADI